MDPVSEIAQMIDHSLLHPTLTDREFEAGCLLARSLRVATACVKPYAVKAAAGLLTGSGVGVCAVIGFPHGNSLSQVKAFETQKACEDGATEIDMVVNTGKVLSGDWVFVEQDIEAVLRETNRQGAILKVIFENDFLSRDKDKISLCEISSRLGVAFVKTSTGYGFVRGADGTYAYRGATLPDVVLMRRHCSPPVRIKAAGGIRSLDDLLRFKEAGADRIGTTATAGILGEARVQYGYS